MFRACQYIDNNNTINFEKVPFNATNLTKKVFCITLSLIFIFWIFLKEIFFESEKHRYKYKKM